MDLQKDELLAGTVLDSYEDEDLNRTFIIRAPCGALKRFVRCGQYGIWLVTAEPLGSRIEGEAV